MAPIADAEALFATHQPGLLRYLSRAVGRGTCQVHTVTLDARLVLQPSDPALARARYSADLWLVHTDPGGTAGSEIGGRRSPH